MSVQHLFLRPGTHNLEGHYIYPDGRRVRIAGVRRVIQVAKGKRRVEVESRTNGEPGALQKVTYEVDVEEDRPISRFQQQASRKSTRLKGEGISTDRALTIGYDSEDRSLVAQETSVRLSPGRYLVVGAVWQHGDLLFAYEIEAVEAEPGSSHEAAEPSSTG